MKLLSTLRQPTNIGIGLFAIAASVLLAMIYTGHAGLTTVALMLAQVAPPLCSMAIAVLIFLALHERQADSEA